jgi:hypothetical protein
VHALTHTHTYIYIIQIRKKTIWLDIFDKETRTPISCFLKMPWLMILFAGMSHLWYDQEKAGIVNDIVCNVHWEQHECVKDLQPKPETSSGWIWSYWNDLMNMDGGSGSSEQSIFALLCFACLLFCIFLSE